jgi:hypothetical protein
MPKTSSIHPKPKSALMLAVIMCSQLLMSQGVWAANEPQLWTFWDQSANEISDEVTTIDHSVWQSLLDQHLVTNDSSGINLFRYSAIAAKDDLGTQASKTLNAYIASLETIDPRSLNKDQQFAYWVNLYNSVTVRTIVDAYPIKSIRNAGKSFFSFGPWDEELVSIAGQPVTLNDIEHRILRPIWDDSRIHFVVNCASYGCPNLPKTALTAENHQTILEQARTAFINHPRAISIDKDELTISSIFDWYKQDFGGNQATVLEYLSTYLEGDQKKALAQAMLNSDLNIKYDYDWSLNEVNESQPVK